MVNRKLSQRKSQSNISSKRKGQVKKTVVSCGVTRGIFLETKLKMAIFTVYLPLNYKIGFWYVRRLCIRDTVSNKTYQISETKGWSDQEVNTQFEQDLNP